MTFLGKLLVFLNVILATALLSWSVSLYTNRVDWPAVETDGKKLSDWPPLHVKDAAANNGLYADARESVRGAEVQLAGRVKALNDQLDLAKAGTTPPFFFELERVGLKPGQSPSDRFDLTRDPARQTRVARKDGTSVPLLGLSVLLTFPDALTFGPASVTSMLAASTAICSVTTCGTVAPGSEPLSATVPLSRS